MEFPNVTEVLAEEVEAAEVDVEPEDWAELLGVV